MSTAYSGDGITFPDNTVQATAPRVGMVNRIINGDMRIDQRNGGALINPVGASYTVDRWYYYQSQASKGSIGQNAGAIAPPTGFNNYLGFTSSSAYSITATDQFLIQQSIEGFNISDLGWGTVNAKTVTLSFWVYSSLTGTLGGTLQNSANNRNYPFTYTVSSANTWEQKTVNIAGDTTGTWLTTNGKGIVLNFSLGTGSTYSATAGAWSSSSFVTSATGATSVVGTSGATFYITGVQLEKGSTATDFEYVDYGRQLQMCQRYFENITLLSSMASPAQCFSTTAARGGIRFVTTKRASPDIAASGTFILSRADGSSASGVSLSFSSNAQTLYFNASGATSLVAGHATNLTNGTLTAAAEL